MIELAALVLVLILLMYWPCENGEPVMDDMSIFGNLSLIQGKWIEQFRSWRSPRVLTRVSWALCACGPGRQVGPFIEFLHLGNVLLHGIAALLTVPIGQAAGVNPALVVLLFAVHPFASSAVANMSHRASILAYCFVLGAIDAALLGFWPLSPVLLTVAFLSKEDAVGPLSLLFTITNRAKAYLSVVDDGLKTAGLSGSLPWNRYLPSVVVENLLRLPQWFLGLGQSVSHSLHPRRWSDLWIVTPLVPVVVLMALSPIPAHRVALLLFLLSPFVLYLGIRIKDTVVEGRWYSWTLPFALLWASLPLPIPVFTALIVLFAAMTARRAWFHQNQILFWKSALTAMPSERVLLNYGASLASHGDPVSAIEQYETILRRNPAHALALLNLGLLLEDEANRYYARGCGTLEQTGKRSDDFKQFKHYRKLAKDKISRAFELAPKDSIVSSHWERFQKDKRVKV